MRIFLLAILSSAVAAEFRIRPLSCNHPPRFIIGESDASSIDCAHYSIFDRIITPIFKEESSSVLSPTLGDDDRPVKGCLFDTYKVFILNHVIAAASAATLTGGEGDDVPLENLSRLLMMMGSTPNEEDIPSPPTTTPVAETGYVSELVRTYMGWNITTTPLTERDDDDALYRLSRKLDTEDAATLVEAVQRLSSTRSATSTRAILGPLIQKEIYTYRGGNDTTAPSTRVARVLTRAFLDGIRRAMEKTLDSVQEAASEWSLDPFNNISSLHFYSMVTRGVNLNIRARDLEVAVREGAIMGTQSSTAVTSSSLLLLRRLINRIGRLTTKARNLARSEFTTLSASFLADHRNLKYNLSVIQMEVKNATDALESILNRVRSPRPYGIVPTPEDRARRLHRYNANLHDIKTMEQRVHTTRAHANSCEQILKRANEIAISQYIVKYIGDSVALEIIKVADYMDSLVNLANTRGGVSELATELLVQAANLHGLEAVRLELAERHRLLPPIVCDTACIQSTYDHPPLLSIASRQKLHRLFTRRIDPQSGAISSFSHFNTICLDPNSGGGGGTVDESGGVQRTSNDTITVDEFLKAVAADVGRGMFAANTVKKSEDVLGAYDTLAAIRDVEALLGPSALKCVRVCMVSSSIPSSYHQCTMYIYRSLVVMLRHLQLCGGDGGDKLHKESFLRNTTCSSKSIKTMNSHLEYEYYAYVDWVYAKQLASPSPFYASRLASLKEVVFEEAAEYRKKKLDDKK